MSIQQYKYQVAAINDVVAKSKLLLSLKGTGARPLSLLLEAPTGAGKTVIMSAAISRLLQEFEGNLAFVWLAPYSLHVQSFERIREACEEQGEISCVLLEDLNSPDIPAKTVAFVNWASISGDSKALRKEQETGKSLGQIVDETKAGGTKVVVIVDESHHSLSGKEAQLVLNKILRPDLVIEVTATPQLTGHDEKVKVHRDAVLKEHVIRKSVVLNPGLTQGLKMASETAVTFLDPGSKEAVIDVAMQHLKTLRDAYVQEKSKVAPLMLIQLPDSGNAPEGLLEELIAHLAANHGLSLENGKVAVRLSGDKANLDGIEKFDSAAEVLFFKQSIALGWDCPRAQILVCLRELRSPSFTSQVLGRILRQPERKEYAKDMLNFGYVFVNNESFSVTSEIDSIPAKATMLASESVVIGMPYYYRRSNETGRKLQAKCASAISDAVMQEVRDLVHLGKVEMMLLSDVELESVDKDEKFDGKESGIYAGAASLQKALDGLISGAIKQGNAFDKGRNVVRQALMNAASELSGETDELRLLEVLLHPTNLKRLAPVVRQAVMTELENSSVRASAITAVSSWAVPKHRQIPLSDVSDKYRKCLYHPVFESYFDTGDERQFALLLASNDKVKWWFKNGTKSSEHFAIPSGPAKHGDLFYPDFVVHYEDGTYGFYDTKGHHKGGTAGTVDAKEKAEALAAYVAEQRNAGHKVDGGLVVLDAAGSWRICRSAQYAWSRELTGWEKFF